MSDPGDITPEQGAAVVRAAAAWAGTPYALVGAASVRGQGGDCSGSTWRIFEAAGLPYEYQPTGSFAAYARRSGRFRELRADEPRQEGDVLFWPGHMAIATSFADDPAHASTPRTNARGAAWTQVNDMWSATRPGGAAFGPNATRWFRQDAPRVFRYVQR